MAVAKSAKKNTAAVQKHPFIAKTPKNFGIGQTPLPKGRDLTRFVRYPTAVQFQRKKAVLLSKLKRPYSLRAFDAILSKNEATQVFRLLAKYRPETPEQKKQRLVAEAEQRTKGEDPSKNKRPTVLQFGLNHVTEMIEQKKAKLVLIAHDVDPVELVCWLPTLCRKMEVPYGIVKGRARLGALVHQKNAAVVALDSVRKEDQAALEQIAKNFEDHVPKKAH